MVQGTRGEDITHNGCVEMDGTVGLHGCGYRWEVELSVVGARTGRNLDGLPISKLPGSTRLL